MESLGKSSQLKEKTDFAALSISLIEVEYFRASPI
jgi:hypothetical protein